MGDLQTRLESVKSAIRAPSFRRHGKIANGVNYWIFDYPPEQELEVRKWIAWMGERNWKETDGFELAVFDLYDITMEFLERKGFLEKCRTMEAKNGIQRVVKAVNNSLRMNEDSGASVIVQYIQDHTPEDAIVFLTGVGKCYPLLRAHTVLNKLYPVFRSAPVVLFYPGTYDERELVLFNRIRDGNHYRALRLVK